MYVIDIVLTPKDLVTAGVDNTKFKLVNSKTYGTFTVNILVLSGITTSFKFYSSDTLFLSLPFKY